MVTKCCLLNELGRVPKWRFEYLHDRQLIAVSLCFNLVESKEQLNLRRAGVSTPQVHCDDVSLILAGSSFLLLAVNRHKQELSRCCCFSVPKITRFWFLVYLHTGRDSRDWLEHLCFSPAANDRLFLLFQISYIPGVFSIWANNHRDVTH